MISKKIDHAFIMAAGRGTRLMPLTQKIPKGLIKYKQSSLISNGIDKLRKYINFIHISVGYKGPILAKHLIEKKVSSIVNTDNKGNAWWIFNSIFKYFDKPIYAVSYTHLRAHETRGLGDVYKRQILTLKKLKKIIIKRKNLFV